MPTWQHQGAAWVAAFPLTDGRPGKVVVVAGRENPKGAVIVLPPGPDGAVQSVPLAQGFHLLTAVQVIDIVCMQERAFGAYGDESGESGP